VGKLYLNKDLIDWGKLCLYKNYTHVLKLYNPTNKVVDVKFKPDNHELTISKQGVDSLMIIRLSPYQLDSVQMNIMIQDTSSFGAYHTILHLEINGNLFIKGVDMYGVVMDNFDAVLPECSPRILIKQDTYLCDTVQNDEKKEIIVDIKNIGSSNLIVRKIEATCGCTVPNIKKRVISPQDSTKMIVLFDPHGRYGVQYKQIRILTNDPQNPIKEIAIKGYVK
jgi:hypothetical protein